jgi:hypothetical protein
MASPGLRKSIGPKKLIAILWSILILLPLWSCITARGRNMECPYLKTTELKDAASQNEPCLESIKSYELYLPEGWTAKIGELTTEPSGNGNFKSDNKILNLRQGNYDLILCTNLFGGSLPPESPAILVVRDARNKTEKGTIVVKCLFIVEQFIVEELNAKPEYKFIDNKLIKWIAKGGIAKYVDTGETDEMVLADGTVKHMPRIITKHEDKEAIPFGIEVIKKEKEQEKPSPSK